MGLERILNLPSSSAIGSSPAAPTSLASSPRQDAILEQLSQGFQSLTSTVSTLSQGFSNLTSTVNQLSQGFSVLSSTVESQGQQISKLTTLVKNLATSTPSVVPNDPDKDDGGDSTPPASTPPTTPSEPNEFPFLGTKFPLSSCSLSHLPSNSPCAESLH